MSAEEADTRLRAVAFAFVDGLASRFGGRIPARELEAFEFEGRRVSLLQHMRGIRVVSGFEAALSIRTVYRARPEERPYDDDQGLDGYWRYKWQGNDPDAYDNVALRRAMQLGKPMLWFVGVAPGEYVSLPVWLVDEEPERQQFVVALDQVMREQWRMAALPSPADLALRRQYAETVVRQRLHQRVFRERVLIAYSSRCALCRLRHPELLDAAHIKEDADGGEPIVPNGVAMCAIHHRAFDAQVIGIRPDYVIEVRPDVRDEHDGPTLLYTLQGLHRAGLELPRARAAWPKPELLEERFERGSWPQAERTGGWKTADRAAMDPVRPTPRSPPSQSPRPPGVSRPRQPRRSHRTDSGARADQNRDRCVVRLAELVCRCTRCRNALTADHNKLDALISGASDVAVLIALDARLGAFPTWSESSQCSARPAVQVGCEKADVYAMVPRLPGEFATRYVRAMRLVLAGSLAIGVAVGALLGVNVLIMTGAACASILVFAQPQLRELGRWTQGAKGERRVGAVLESLSDKGFRCLHDLDIGQGNVDHVAVGPTGVFSIETKAWTHRVWLASRPARLMTGRRDETKSIRQVTREAMAVKARLAKEGHSVWVKAVIALTDAKLPRGPIRLNGVTIADIGQLPSLLADGPSTLTPETVVRLSNAILRNGELVVARSLGTD